MIVSEIKFTGPLWLAAEGRLLGPGVACALGIGRVVVAGGAGVVARAAAAMVRSPIAPAPFRLASSRPPARP